MGLAGAGTYDKMMIDSIQVVPHKVEGEPCIRVRLTDVETQDSITDFLYTSNAAWDAVTQDRLKAYGWDPATNSYAISQLHNNADLIGTEVGPVHVKEEMFEGKLRSKVSGVGSYVAKPADPGMLAAAEAKLRARLAPGASARKPAVKKANPLAAAPRPSRETAAPGDINPAVSGAYDDDVPF